MDGSFALVLLAWLLAGMSPGPATLRISGAAMQHGRRAGLATASGVLAGSAVWGIAAAFGLSALMLANAWLVELIRYAGAAYLMYLACKAAKAAIINKPLALVSTNKGDFRSHFRAGFLIHITNPKAIFAWGAMFAVVVPPGTGLLVITQTFVALFSVSMFIFWGYGFLFSTNGAMRIYRKLRRVIEFSFAGLFGAAGLKILTTRIGQ